MYDKITVYSRKRILCKNIKEKSAGICSNIDKCYSYLVKEITKEYILYVRNRSPKWVDWESHEQTLWS
jgi:hypothetical protein